VGSPSGSAAASSAAPYSPPSGRIIDLSRPGRWPRLQWGILAAVFLGGAVGGLARYAITSVWPTGTESLPWATFAINTGGAFLLSLLAVLLAEMWAPRRYLRPLIGTGFLGAFTTFSSVVVVADQLTAHGHAATAAGYLAGTVLAALAAAALGLVLGRAIATRRP
jgi:CrcB protein